MVSSWQISGFCGLQIGVSERTSFTYSSSTTGGGEVLISGFSTWVGWLTEVWKWWWWWWRLGSFWGCGGSGFGVLAVPKQQPIYGFGLQKLKAGSVRVLSGRE